MRPIAIVMLSFLMISCSETEQSEPLGDSLPQTWILVRFNAGLSGEVFSGEDLPYRESIILNTDSTFTRIRIRNDEQITAIGTFEYTQQNKEDYLILGNAEENDLIGNCSQSLEEWFLFSTPTNLLGGGLPCDRPGLEYERVE
ncbi:MAG: hypothetical protein AAF717_05005 [Bacteroidota bacterium]